MEKTFETSATLELVKDYYGKTLGGNKDLKTSACCTTDSIPAYLRDILAKLPKEIVEKFYGCGSPIPTGLAGKTVLDLGCGTGRDVYLVSKLVGAQGKVLGVDMTDEQLRVARQYQDEVARQFGFASSNVSFLQGYIEDLESLGIEDRSVDVVISNCVINLSPEKKKVFSEILRVLKPGGELYFSDVFADRRIPAHLLADSELYGECLSGALYVEDFRRIMEDLGVKDFRVVRQNKITLNSPEIEAKAGMITFYSITHRIIKLDSLEDRCEDYGQIAVYQGTIGESPHFFELDDHHQFFAGKPMAVCGNTAAMVSQTRFARHFKILGDTSVHYGPFDCGPEGAAQKSDDLGACC